MFQSLYRRFHEELTHQALARQPGGPVQGFSWPATYPDGFAPVDLERYTLTLGGLIEPQPLPAQEDTAAQDISEPLFESEIVLDWEALSALPRHRQERRIVSAQGWSYKGAWEGILLKDLVEMAKPLPEAKFLRQVNLLGHDAYLPLASALSGNALLCDQAGGKPLSPLYGGPLWLAVFDCYHYKGLGQVCRLEFVAEEAPGFWETRGYSPQGAIVPGNYYAFDLRALRPIQHPGEVTEY